MSVDVEIFDLVVDTIEVVELATGPEGPPGPDGAPGTSGVTEWTQPTPASTWTIEHNLGRRPGVHLFLDDQPTDAPMVTTTTHVIVTWPYPVAGSATIV